MAPPAFLSVTRATGRVALARVYGLVGAPWMLGRSGREAVHLVLVLVASRLLDREKKGEIHVMRPRRRNTPSSGGHQLDLNFGGRYN
jgi:hypothetical protein